MRPVAINHLLDLKTGNSRPQVFECDDGIDRVVKFPGVTAAASLASDWIGSLLAGHLDILTPRPALIDVTYSAVAQLPDNIRGRAVPGTAYSNTYIRPASGVGGLEGLIICSNHASLLASLLVLDTWIETTDRMRPDFGRNLLVDGEEKDRRLMAVDFGLAFPPALFHLPGLPEDFDGDAVTLPREVWPLLDWDALNQSLTELEATSDADVIKTVETTPVEWLDRAKRGTVIRYLLHRRGLVRTVLQRWGDSQR